MGEKKVSSHLVFLGSFLEVGCWSNHLCTWSQPVWDRKLPCILKGEETWEMFEELKATQGLFCQYTSVSPSGSRAFRRHMLHRLAVSRQEAVSALQWQVMATTKRSLRSPSSLFPCPFTEAFSKAIKVLQMLRKRDSFLQCHLHPKAGTPPFREVGWQII